MKLWLKQFFCVHKWDWWCNTRKPKVHKGGRSSKTRYDASVWFCKKCRKQETRGYAYHG